MNKSKHIIWAAVFYILAYIIFNPILRLDGPTIFITILITLVYSLLPDLDLKSSWIKNQFNRIVAYFIIIIFILFFITIEFNILIIAIILVLAELFLQLIKHRTLLHSPFFGFLISIPLFFISFPNYAYFGAGLIGYFSHIFLDKIKK